MTKKITEDVYKYKSLTGINQFASVLTGAATGLQTATELSNLVPYGKLVTAPLATAAIHATTGSSLTFFLELLKQGKITEQDLKNIGMDKISNIVKFLGSIINAGVRHSSLENCSEQLCSSITAQVEQSSGVKSLIGDSIQYTPHLVAPELSHVSNIISSTHHMTASELMNHIHDSSNEEHGGLNYLNQWLQENEKINKFTGTYINDLGKNVFKKGFASTTEFAIERKSPKEFLKFTWNNITQEPFNTLLTDSIKEFEGHTEILKSHKQEISSYKRVISSTQDKKWGELSTPIFEEYLATAEKKENISFYAKKALNKSIVKMIDYFRGLKATTVYKDESNE